MFVTYGVKFKTDQMAKGSDFKALWGIDKEFWYLPDETSLVAVQRLGNFQNPILEPNFKLWHAPRIWQVNNAGDSP